MRKTLTILVLLLTLRAGATHYFISPGGDGGFLNNGGTYHAGDTLSLNGAFVWTYFFLGNTHGASGNSIVINNYNGRVIWNANTTNFKLLNCTYIKVTGSGDPTIYLGLFATDSTAKSSQDDAQSVGFDIEGRSAYIEMERFGTKRKTYGMWIKQDPGCVDSLNYPNWHMDSIYIHHARFDTSWQDVIYAGNTSPTGDRAIVCGATTTYPIPIRLSNCRLNHIAINWAWRTGIQLSGCDSGSHNEMSFDTVYNVGHEFNNQQGDGIAVGGMTASAYVHDNIIKKTFLYGIFGLGVATNYYNNNYIDSSGYIDVNPAYNMDSLVAAVNASFSAQNGGASCPVTYSGHTLINTCSQPSSMRFDVRPTYQQSANGGAHINNQGVAEDSSIIKVWSNKLGLNVGATNIYVYDSYNTFNVNGSIICSNTKLDGVTPANIDTRHNHEPALSHFTYSTDCSSLLGAAPSANAGSNQTITLPTNSVLLSGSGTAGSGHTIASYAWTKASGPSAGAITSPSSVSTTVTGLTNGVYLFQLAVTQDDAQVATATVQVTVNNGSIKLQIKSLQPLKLIEQ